MDMGHDRCLVTLSFFAIKIINKIYEENFQMPRTYARPDNK